ncbi:MAG: hypothetical protein R3C44_17970 [Chloroflexota bacterium]
MYPHAYRDHWVAQQYLPDTLQGKVFYQPGDIGYEADIQIQVTRRREAQLAAMVEGEADEHLEILTTSPTNRSRDAWLQRVIAGSGRKLGDMRDRMFDLAAVQRHHLVLDINAGSGLLTWEALRRAPEGGVWALAADPQAGEALRQQAERLPEVERPVVLIGRPDELPFILALRDEEDIRFDRILARNTASRSDEWGQAIPLLFERLAPDGRLVLSQAVPRHTQRLYALVDWNGAEALGERIRAAEETIYADPDDPLVNWDTDDLTADLKAAGFVGVVVTTDSQTEERRITVAHLERWFEVGEEDRASYAQRLAAAGLDAGEIEAVKARYTRQLVDQVVSWEATLATVVGEKLDVPTE